MIHHTLARLLLTTSAGLAALLLGLGAAAAQAAAPAAPAARPADDILDDYAKAMGAAAAARFKGVYMKRQLTVKNMNVQGTEERWAASSGKFLSVTDMPGVGVVKTGSTGSKRWSQDPINGLRILEGAEDELTRIDGTWNADAQLKKLFKGRKTVPVPAGAPRDAKLECVELTPEVARPSVMCFDAITHLRVYQEGKQSSPQGELPYMLKMSDWREVEGVKVPHREEMTAGPLTVESKLLELKFNPKLAAGQFNMPRPGKK